MNAPHSKGGTVLLVGGAVFLLGSLICASTPSPGHEPALLPTDTPTPTATAVQWTLDIIEELTNTTDQYGDTSLTVNSTGQPAIAYQRRLTLSGVSYAKIMYAESDGMNWYTHTVPLTGTYDWPLSTVSLALDGAGLPHISYHYMDPPFWPYVGGHLAYISHDGSGWITSTIDYGAPRLPVGVFSSLVLSDDDQPSIAYGIHGNYQDEQSLVAYATYTGTSWITETAELSMGTPWHIFLAEDGNGQPHIGYYDYSGNSNTTQSLRYGGRIGSVWTFETITTTLLASPELNSSAFWLDELDQPHAAFVVRTCTFPCTDTQLVLASRNDDTGWSFETLPDAANPSGHVSLVVRGGDPYIAYADKLSGLTLVYKHANSWHIEEVDTTGGEDVALVIDGLGRPQVSYLANPDNRKLIYASRTCIVCNPAPSLVLVYLPFITGHD
jgi:hypothetical protein